MKSIIKGSTKDTDEELDGRDTLGRAYGKVCGCFIIGYWSATEPSALLSSPVAWGTEGRWDTESYSPLIRDTYYQFLPPFPSQNCGALNKMEYQLSMKEIFILSQK